MQSFSGVAQKPNGDVMVGVSVLIKTHPGDAVAVLYDINGAVVTNPVETDNHGVYGTNKVNGLYLDGLYAANGRYSSETSGPGISGTIVKTDSILLFDPTALGTPASGNATNLINTIAPQTNAATSKATPVDSDEVPLTDSAASFGLKKLTWANIKATIKTYFDTLYVGLTNLAASSGSALIGFIQSGIGAVARTMQDKGREIISLHDYLPVGYVTDGSIDYTTYIANWINEVNISSGCVGYLNPGTYKVTALQTITALSGLQIYGAGPEKSILYFVGSGGIRINGIPVGTPIQNIHLRDLCLKGDNTETATGGTGGTSGSIGLELDGCDSWMLSHVTIRNFSKYGLLLDGTSIGTSIGSRYQYNTGLGIKIIRHNDVLNPGPSDSNIFIGGSIQLNGAGGVIVDECDDNKFIGVQMVLNGVISVSEAGKGNSVAFCGSNGNSCTRCFFEKSGDEDVYVRNGLGVQPVIPSGAFNMSFVGNYHSGTTGQRSGGATGDFNITAQTQETYIGSSVLLTSIVNAGTRTTIDQQARVGADFVFTDTGSDTNYKLYLSSAKEEGVRLVGSTVMARRVVVSSSLYTQTSDPVLPRIQLGGVASLSATNTSGRNLRGNFTIGDANTTGTVTFSTAEPDANYFIVLTPVSKVGAPAAGSINIDSVAKLAESFTVTLQTAPGVGTNRGFDWVLIR